MIGTVEVRCSAHRPQMPLQPLFTFCGSPSSVRIMDVPKSIGEWSIDEVKLIVKYPDNSTTVKNAVRNGCVWVATIQGTDISGKVSNGYEIVASGKDEDGNEVNGYVLGCGDVIVINRDVNATKDIEKFYVKWNDELPTNPAKGDLIYHNGNVRLFNGSEWMTLGLDPQIIEGIDNRINEVASSIPTKTSQLTNDSDFATNASVDEKIGGVTSSIPTKTSQLENDSGFLTQHQSLSNYYTKTETNEAISRSVSSKVDAKYIESEDGKKRIFGNGEVSVLSSTPDVYGPWTDANGNTRTDLQVKLVDPNVPTYVWGNSTLSFFSVAFNSLEEAETATEFEEAIPNRGYHWTRSYTPGIDIWVKEGELATKTYVDNAIGNVLTQEEF